MAEIRVALVTLPWGEPHIARLNRALEPAEVIRVHRFDALGVAGALRRADVAFLTGDLDERFLRAPLLKWVHCGHAGIERSALPEVFDHGLQVTSAAGRSAPALAEHAMLFMLALSFRYGHILDAQRAHRWGVRGQQALRALCGQTLGIVGLGHTGVELAKRAKAFGMRVLAIRRSAQSSPAVDRLYSLERGENLDELLEESDYVVLALPLSDRTYHLIGPKQLARMRPTAHLVNIARGGLVDEPALITALRARRLAGAAIDVAQEEPLPGDSPLWDTPNLLITPHVTPQLEDRVERALEILLENVQRYRSDRPLLNQLTTDDLFTRISQPGTLLGSGGLDLVTRIERLARRLVHRWRAR